MISRARALEVVRETLAADYACEPAHFDVDGVLLVPSALREGRRNYVRPARDLAACTTGRGVIVNFTPERRQWVEKNLAGLDGRSLFSARTLGLMDDFVRADGQELRGPVLAYVCSDDGFTAPPAPEGVAIETVDRPGILKLFEIEGFDMALGRDSDDLRPNLFAAVARRDGEIVGMAGAGREREGLFQLGVEVLPDWRRRGVGRAVVAAVTRSVLDAGAVPFYTTWAANLGSRNTCLGLGYRPAWCEAYALDGPAS